MLSGLSANDSIAVVPSSRQKGSMKKLSAAKSTLLIGAVAAVLLWLLGDTTTATSILIAEALGWAALYAFTANKTE
jgi:hypothetical protein